MIDKNIVGAAAKYDEAIASIRERRFVLWEGTALAMAGENALALGMRSSSQHFFAEACRAYASYRAPTLVAAIVRQHQCAEAAIQRSPQVAPPSSSPSPMPTARSHQRHAEQLRAYLPFNTQLDAYTVLQVTRTLAQEIVLEKLLEEVMRVLIENAGADCACLLLERDNDKSATLEVIAKSRATIGGSTSEDVSKLPLDTADRNSGIKKRRSSRFFD